MTPRVSLGLDVGESENLARMLNALDETRSPDDQRGTDGRAKTQRMCHRHACVEAVRLAYGSGIPEVMPRFFVAADGESALECTEHGCVARSA